MFIDERYNDNIVFNKDGLQQLLDNIKNYPIINAEYLSDGGALTQNSPCVRITFGDSQSEAGFLTYALNFYPEEGHTQADYDALLTNKKQYDGRLKEAQKDFDQYNRIYQELCAFYGQKTKEIQAFLLRYTNANWEDYEQILKDFQTILNNGITSLLVNPNGDPLHYFDGESYTEAAVQYSNSTGTFLYDLSPENFRVEELFSSEIELLTAEEKQYLKDRGTISIFIDYPSYKEQQLKAPLVKYCEALHDYVLNNPRDSKINLNQNNEIYSDIYNILIDDDWSSIGHKTLQTYLYKNQDSISGLDVNDTEQKFLWGIISLVNLTKIIDYYKQKWMDKAFNKNEQQGIDEEADLHTLLTNIYNYIKNNLCSYVQCTEDDLSSLNFLEIYSKNNDNTYTKVEDKSNITQANIENYYKLTCGELYQKILKAKAGLDRSQRAIRGINGEIIEIENNLNSFNAWAEGIVSSLLDKDKLLGHAYLPVGSNIVFKDSNGENITNLTLRQPGDNEAYDENIIYYDAQGTKVNPQPNASNYRDYYILNDQSTGTFRVSINGKIYEVPIAGLAGGSGAVTLSGDLIPSIDNSYDIGSLDINSQKYRWKDLYLSNQAVIQGTVDGIKRGNQDDSPNGFDSTYTETYYGDSRASISTTGGIYAEKNIWAAKVFNAVFNDYAECRATIDLEPGRVVVDQDDGTLACATARLQPGAQVISDTYGHLMGATEGVTTPIAVAGRVLAYPFGARERYHAGMAVCSAPDGTVDIMTREEIKEYPDCIVGIVSEIPEYEIWGSDNVKVNGRIWIKVK